MKEADYAPLDILAIKGKEVVFCHRPKGSDIHELTGFIQPENYLKNVEMAEEGNYNMIDGIINNLPKEPSSITESKSQIEAGEQILPADLAGTEAPERDQRPSVRKRLKQLLPRHEKSKPIPKKGMEREM